MQAGELPANYGTASGGLDSPGSLDNGAAAAAVHKKDQVVEHLQPNMVPSDAAVCVTPQVKLITAADCQLAVSIYPKFAYNASSGGGAGTVQQLGDNKLQITFDTDGELWLSLLE
jgi:hypothetical protein